MRGCERWSHRVSSSSSSNSSDSSSSVGQPWDTDHPNCKRRRQDDDRVRKNMAIAQSTVLLWQIRLAKISCANRCLTHQFQAVTSAGSGRTPIASRTSTGRVRGFVAARHSASLSSRTNVSARLCQSYPLQLLFSIVCTVCLQLSSRIPSVQQDVAIWSHSFITFFGFLRLTYAHHSALVFLATNKRTSRLSSHGNVRQQLRSSHTVKTQTDSV